MTMPENYWVVESASSGRIHRTRESAIADYLKREQVYEPKAWFQIWDAPGAWSRAGIDRSGQERSRLQICFDGGQVMTKTEQEVRFQEVYVAGSHSVREEKDGYEIARVTLSGHRIYEAWREAGPQDWAKIIAASPYMLTALKAILTLTARHGGTENDAEVIAAIEQLAAVAVRDADGR